MDFILYLLDLSKVMADFFKKFTNEMDLIIDSITIAFLLSVDKAESMLLILESRKLV